MTYDLTNFSLGDTLRCGAALKESARDSSTMEAAALGVVKHLYEHCIDPDNKGRSCALVRFYKTHRYERLEPGLRHFAKRLLEDKKPAESLRCLTLLATVGDKPEWNSRALSRSHRAIPLASAKMIDRAPMIAQLLKQFGLDVRAVIDPSPDVLLNEQPHRSYNAFHIEDAVGSPYIPAQHEFVIPYEIRSVLGFGGSLRTGDLFAVIMFSRTRIPVSTAERFRSIALEVKSAVFMFDENRVFAPKRQ